MIRIILIIISSILSSQALAQNTTCSDRAQTDTSNACANTRYVRSAISTLPGPVTPGGSSGQIQYNNNGSFGGFNFSIGAGLPTIGSASFPGIAAGTKSGNTTNFATTTGTLVNGHCVALDSNGNFIDSGTACSTSPSTFATPGTAKLPGGLIMKWGIVSVAANSTSAVSFATAFSTAAFVCNVSQVGGPTPSLGSPGYQSLSTSGVTINNNHASGQNIVWMCLGN